MSEQKFAIASGAFILLLILLSALLFTTNAEQVKDPNEVITEFYSLASEGEVDQAKYFVSDDVKEFYDNGGTFFASTLESAIVKEGNQYDEVEPLKDTLKVEGNKATIEVKLTDEGYSNNEEYTLLKENNRWKIFFQ